MTSLIFTNFSRCIPKSIKGPRLPFGIDCYDSKCIATTRSRRGIYLQSHTSHSISFYRGRNSIVFLGPLCRQNLVRFPGNYWKSTAISTSASLDINHKTPTDYLHTEIRSPAGENLPEKIVSNAPAAWQPYLRLSRIHRPIGTWLLFLPCTWGLTLGSHGLPDPSLIALFGLGAFIMRGAGCTVNDMWDRHIDAKVKRTIDRPLASGQLRMRHAAAWLGVQLTAAFTILLSLNAPCFIIGVGSLGLVVLYPLAKRVTEWPQAVLGLTFNTGVLMGLTAAQQGQLGYLSMPWIDPACLSLYLAGISWTLFYDTIYAHQDRADDTALGLGSTARKFGDQTKLWIGGFGVGMVTLLTTSGVLAQLNWPYYLAVTATATHLMWQVKTLDIHDHKNCSDRFTSNRMIGWILFFGLAGSYFVQDVRSLKSIFELDKANYDGTTYGTDSNDSSKSIQPLVSKYNTLSNAS